MSIKDWPKQVALPRVAPAAFAEIERVVRAETDELALPDGVWTEAERASVRRVAQVVVSIIVCAQMAGLALSANDVVRVILNMVGAMTLVVPGTNVPRMVGRVFDMVWPPAG